MIKEYIKGLIEFIKAQLKAVSFGVNDFFDILIIAVLMYYVYKFIKQRRAGKLAIGLGVILLIKIVSDVFSFSALGFVISNFFQIGLLAIVILFQPELRSALEQAGGTSLKGLKNLGEKHPQITEQMVEEVCEAACEMAKEKTGALIVFENGTGLNDIISSGTVVNADISSYLLRSIFFENSPLHDGAVVVRDSRIMAAGCFLPLSDNSSIEKMLGTRHRAAIGMSEVSDALVLVVSEETGSISIAQNGHIRRNFDYAGLKKELSSFLIPSDDDNHKKRFNRISKKNTEKAEKQKTGKKKKRENTESLQSDDIVMRLFDGDGE